MVSETVAKLNRIKEEMDNLSMKIVARTSELNGDVITIRNDPIVTDLWHSLCAYHRKAMLLCAGMEESKPEVCIALEKPQACIEALHLSEEEVCCEVFKRKLKGKAEKNKVKFLMSSPVITIDLNSTAADAIKLMKKHGIGSVIVVDKEGIKGIVTERDIASKVYSTFRDPKDVLVKEIMSKKLITINPEANIKDAVRLMSKHNITHLPVIDEKGMLVGIIAVPDFYRD
jgi:CBS domain-containing protein